MMALGPLDLASCIAESTRSKGCQSSRGASNFAQTPCVTTSVVIGKLRTSIRWPRHTGSNCNAHRYASLAVPFSEVQHDWMALPISDTLCDDSALFLEKKIIKNVLSTANFNFALLFPRS